MRLAISGHPLHSRTLGVAVRTGTDDPTRLDAAAEILDVRKRGFVPVAGKLQTGGPIHHMQVEARVDPATRVMERIASRMPRVAFEASAVTGGDTCRDVEGGLAALSGRTLDEAFPRAVAAEIGGPRGCSHVLALARSTADALAAVLDREHPLRLRRPGEPVFHRALVLDGHEPEPGRLELAVQCTDLHMAPAPEVAPPMDRLGLQVEVRLAVRAELAEAMVTGVSGALRQRTLDTLETAGWEPLDARLAPLAGASFQRGFAAACAQIVAGAGPADAALLDALRNAGPAILQCMGSMSETWPLQAARTRSLIGTGSYPDACYMWRRDGALGHELAREVEAGREFHRARAPRAGRAGGRGRPE